MIAVETSILVYAAHRGSALHRRAREVLERLATGPAPWALPFPCIARFLGVVTHRAFRPALSLADALDNVRTLLRSPSALLLTPTGRHLTLLAEVLEESRAAGDMVHDAEIVALCLEHGVREIYTVDRDLRRFQGIRVTDPFAKAGR